MRRGPNRCQNDGITAFWVGMADRGGVWLMAGESPSPINRRGDKFATCNFAEELAQVARYSMPPDQGEKDPPAILIRPTGV